MLNNIFDSHCHYDDRAFDEDRQQLLESLNKEGVANILHASADIESTRYGSEYSKKYDFMYTSVGIHPEFASDIDENWFAEMEKTALENKKTVAVGEIGLDYHYEGYDREKEIYLFRRQMDMAKKLNLPVIIHSRDATEDTLAILREYRLPGVMHCFSGSAETAREVLSLGMYIGFTGVLTFKNAKKAALACAAVPLDRLLLETDCPYMAPEPFRGKRCDSRMIRFTAEKAAEIKGVDAQTLINAANENTVRLFGIK